MTPNELAAIKNRTVVSRPSAVNDLLIAPEDDRLFIDHPDPGPHNAPKILHLTKWSPRARVGDGLTVGVEGYIIGDLFDLGHGPWDPDSDELLRALDGRVLRVHGDTWVEHHQDHDQRPRVTTIHFTADIFAPGEYGHDVAELPENMT